MIKGEGKAEVIDLKWLLARDEDFVRAAEWRLRRVGLDYHVDIDGHYYSVPHRLIREQLDARITAHTVELFRKGERVAVHLRGVARGRHTAPRCASEMSPTTTSPKRVWTNYRVR